MPLSKLSSVLDFEQQAAAQSASELMTQGLLKVELSPRQQLAYDDAVRYAAKVDAQERAHFEHLPERIAEENAQIMADLNEGKLYLINRTGDYVNMIHFATCRTIRHQIDRELARTFALVDGEQDASLHPWHGRHEGEGVAKWPNLVTLDEVEALRSYRTCQHCNPDTKQRRKVAGVRNAPSKITSVTVDRIGREYETPEGEYLGILESYTVSANKIVLHCSEQDFEGTRDSMVTLLPKGA